MEMKEICQKLNQFLDEVNVGGKHRVNLSLFSDAADHLEELEGKQENLVDYNADLNNQLNKAESHIEKLEKQLSQQQPEWISVEDRLPEKNGRYLVYNQKIIYITYCEAGNFIFKDITHWMPLPEPPKPKEPTFKDVFFEKFPKAIMYNDGIPLSCRASIFGGKCSLGSTKCFECWNQPYFETEEGEADA